MLRRKKSRHSVSDATHEVADRLHSLAIHLLRRLRRVDAESRLSGPRLSALSVVVFGGPMAPSALARAEQVARPTMTRIVQGLERDGYVTREPDPFDRRVMHVTATKKGSAVMHDGRQRRVAMLSALLAELPASELREIRAAVDALESIVAGRRDSSRK
ncbi:MAG: MarR family transcriptional regulator [Gemmatimonadaceae bacterium]|nr:MarR family transcriptional regulator [Gemmatimonadaceae bacterium]